MVLPLTALTLLECSHIDRYMRESNYTVPFEANSRGRRDIQENLSKNATLTVRQGRLFLKNKSGKKVWITALSGRLFLFREARDPTGKWRPTQYWCPDFCGNAYYSVMLGPRHSWSWPAPLSTGSYSTNCRFVLSGYRTKLVSPEYPCHISSNEFRLQPAFARYLEVRDDGAIH